MLAELLYTGLGCLIFGALAAPLLGTKFKKSWLVSIGVSLIGSLCVLGSALQIMGLRSPFILRLPLSTLGMIDQSLYLDRLSGFFLMVIAIGAVLVSLYSFGINLHYSEAGKNLSYFAFLYNIFLLAMYLVVLAGNVVLFLIMWEIMSLSSYLLVLYEHEEKHVRQAGFIYVVMTHLGTVFISISYFLLAKAAGGLNWENLSLVSKNLNTGLANIIFLLAVIGFGTKAGLIPLHIWLPRAHPAAPTNVSALMSGVMVKTALYGLLRFLFTFLPTGPWWWGGLLLILGALSALLGSMYAVLQKNLKGLLAYSTVENMGIICLGLGAALILRHFQFYDLAILAGVAFLYHLMNHAVFKTLLFMGAGSIISATHTKNMDLLGGLLKRMPYTGLFFLCGVASLVALPPLNGFVGEWLILKALFNLSIAIDSLTIKALGLLAISVLALVGALVATAGVKMYGSVFLALPRSYQAEKARETSLSMHIAMGLAAFICVVLGVLPGKISLLLGSLLELYWPSARVPAQDGFWQLCNVPKLGGEVYYPLFLGLLIVIIAILTWRLLPFIFGQTSVRRSETWTCGITPDATMEYTGTGFTEPVRVVFKNIFLPTREISQIYQVRPYFSRVIYFRDNIKPVIEEGLYKPLMKLFLAFSKYVRRMQTGSVQMYLAYILITLVILLATVR
ncbi:MAG: formate hydrogenlyase subunit 3/multisubunit Na+/H+ antiporter, MnhD subunit [Peptococcaceae bacterium]|nr:formate hydrogenlyase subunit 3/multisubunit Na+/H+ antiporter, MnhD subunit [Peptococcaceae bacterium]